MLFKVDKDFTVHATKEITINYVGKQPTYAETLIDLNAIIQKNIEQVAQLPSFLAFMRHPAQKAELAKLSYDG